MEGLANFKGASHGTQTYRKSMCYSKKQHIPREYISWCKNQETSKYGSTKNENNEAQDNEVQEKEGVNL